MLSNIIHIDTMVDYFHARKDPLLLLFALSWIVDTKCYLTSGIVLEIYIIMHMLYSNGY